MLLGLILSATGIVLFAWAMFRLAVFALPVGLGAAAFLWAGVANWGRCSVCFSASSSASRSC